MHLSKQKTSKNATLTEIYMLTLLFFEWGSSRDSRFGPRWKTGRKRSDQSPGRFCGTPWSSSEENPAAAESYLSGNPGIRQAGNMNPPRLPSELQNSTLIVSNKILKKNSRSFDECPATSAIFQRRLKKLANYIFPPLSPFPRAFA